LPSIQLNDQSSFKANKVSYIMANRVLTPELHAFKAACPQTAP